MKRNYTNCTDINGKKIYDGDIVEHTQHYLVSESVKSNALVKWSEAYNRYIVSNLTSGLCDRFLDDVKVKVIGNIHDNPELLKENNL